MKEWLLIVYATFGYGHDAIAIKISPEDLGYNFRYESSELAECKLNSKLINVKREVISVDTNYIFSEEYNEKREIFHAYCVEVLKLE